MSERRIEELEQRLILANKKIVELEAEAEAWRVKAEELALGVEQDAFFKCRNPFKLSRYEQRLLVALLCRPNGMSKGTILDALYAHRNSDEVPELKIVDVFICKLRGKLEAHGFPRTAVETLWGRGYRIADGQRTPLAEALELDLTKAALNYDNRRILGAA